MFTNMGGKIKVLAKVLCWINIALGIIAALGGIVVSLNTISHNGNVAVAVIVGCIVGAAIWALFAWLGSFMLCGYGELIENTAITAKNTQTLIEMKSFELNAHAAKSNTAKPDDNPKTDTEAAH